MQAVCFLRTGRRRELLSKRPYFHSTSNSIRGDFLSPHSGKSYISSPLRFEAIKASLLMLCFACSSAFHFSIAEKLRQVFHLSSHGGGGDRLARTMRQGEVKEKRFNCQLLIDDEKYQHRATPLRNEISSCLLHFH